MSGMRKRKLAETQDGSQSELTETQNIQVVANMLSQKQPGNPFVKEFQSIVEKDRVNMVYEIEAAEARISNDQDAFRASLLNLGLDQLLKSPDSQQSPYADAMRAVNCSRGLVLDYDSAIKEAAQARRRVHDMQGQLEGWRQDVENLHDLLESGRRTYGNRTKELIGGSVTSGPTNRDGGVKSQQKGQGLFPEHEMALYYWESEGRLRQPEGSRDLSDMLDKSKKGVRVLCKGLADSASNASLRK